jgi:flagellar assembly factor FliW
MNFEKKDWVNYTTKVVINKKKTRMLNFILATMD